MIGLDLERQEFVDNKLRILLKYMFALKFSCQTTREGQPLTIVRNLPAIRH